MSSSFARLSGRIATLRHVACVLKRLIVELLGYMSGHRNMVTPDLER